MEGGIQSKYCVIGHFCSQTFMSNKKGGAITVFGPTGKVALATSLGTNCKMDWRVDSVTLGI
jgi:hypothetical protein